ncbi:MAG: hypothetical protein ACXVES_07515 [Actinomycetota bacterium]
MRQSARLLISGGLLLAVSLAVGLVLVTRTRVNRYACLDSLRHPAPCHPPTSLPYFLQGFILLVVGSFVGLVLLAFGVRRWAQTRAPRDYADAN